MRRALGIGLPALLMMVTATQTGCSKGILAAVMVGAAVAEVAAEAHHAHLHARCHARCQLQHRGHVRVDPDEREGVERLRPHPAPKQPRFIERAQDPPGEPSPGAQRPQAPARD